MKLAVKILRKGLEEGKDTSICILNYKADGKSRDAALFI